jgi:lysyl-tRNA synthetase class 1
VVKEIEKRKGTPLTEVERRHLDERIASAREWVAKYATEHEKTHLQLTLPNRAQELSETQRAFLHRLADALPETVWEENALQSKIFETARLTPLEQALAFKAIYRVLLDRDSGPKAGNLLAFLDPGFVVPRFRELPVVKPAFWRESATTEEQLRCWLEEHHDKIANRSWSTLMEGSVAVFELMIEMKDGKKELKRLLVEGTPADRALSGLIASVEPRLPTKL